MTGTNTTAPGAESHVLLWSVYQWNVPLWATIALGVLLIPGGSYATWYWARSFATGRFRFGLRTFLIGIAFTAIILACRGFR